MRKMGKAATLLTMASLLLWLASACGSGQTCPSPVREEQSFEPPPGAPESTGGEYEVAGLLLLLPEDRDFRIGVVTSSPEEPKESPATSEASAGAVRIYDIATSSAMDIGTDGCELHRWVGDADADPVFDSIVEQLQVQ